MKVTLESTDEFVYVNGLRVRVWEGETEAGVGVTAYVARLRVLAEEDTSEFEKDLVETVAPEIMVAP